MFNLNLTVKENYGAWLLQTIFTVLQVVMITKLNVGILHLSNVKAQPLSAHNQDKLKEEEHHHCQISLIPNVPEPWLTIKKLDTLQLDIMMVL